MSLELDREAEDRAIQSIRRCVADRWEREIGDLKARMLLDFILKEIRPTL